MIRHDPAYKRPVRISRTISNAFETGHREQSVRRAAGSRLRIMSATCRCPAMTLPVRFALFCVLGVFVAMLFASSAIAQDTLDTPGKIQQEPHTRGRFGLHFSGPGLKDNDELRKYRSYATIESAEHDIMPYPFGFFSIRYNTFEISMAWADDDLNENIFRFTARYNYYTTKNIYTYGGVVFWRWNKKYNFFDSVCDEYDYNDYRYGNDEGYECKPGKSREIELKTGRPNGKFTTLGVTLGAGVEYKVAGGLVFSHEVELYIAPCSYDNFICSGPDIKFWGIHFPF